MKKLLVMMLVMVMASAASATVIDVVAVDIGQSGGRTGTINDPLEESDTIGLKLVLNTNPYAGWASYDGYVLSSMDLSLDVVGAGTLSCPVTTDKNGNILTYDIGEHADWTFLGDPTISDDGIDRLLYASTAGINAGSVEVGSEWVPQPQDLIWDLLLHCGGAGDVTIDLSAAAGEYSPYTNAAGVAPYPDPPGWLDLDNTKVGDLTIYQVPEPMTMVLLGLGGLLLRRRR